jgi:hypothetical protein
MDQDLVQRGLLKSVYSFYTSWRLSISIVGTVHVARCLRPVPEQQTDTLSVMGPSDALCDRRTRIDLDELGAVMPGL